MAILASPLPQLGFRTRVFLQGDFCAENSFSGDGQFGHIHLIKKGPVRFEHENSPYLEVNVPTLVIYPRPYRHRLVAPSAKADLKCATIEFRHAQCNPLARLLPPYLALPLDEVRNLETSVQMLLDEAEGGREGKQEMMDSLCDILLIQVFRQIQRKTILPANLAGVKDSRIASVITAMHNAPAKPWTIEEMARIAAMSRSSFARHFHEIAGTPPASYLTDLRLRLATVYLRQYRSVKRTAQAVGYNSQPAFTKAFSGRFGAAPLKWLAGQHQSNPS